MSKYTCKCCDYNTNDRTKYERHLKTKKHEQCIQNVSKMYPNVSTMYPNVSKEDSNNFTCKYCGKAYKYSQGLSKHIKYTCKKNKDEDLRELVKLLNERMKTMEDNHKETQILLKREIKKRDKEIVRRDKQITKLSKKLQINNGNIITNNYHNITLLDYKNTDVSHLTHDDYIQSIKRVNHCVKTLTEKIHYNPKKPENMNIYISNLKNDYVTMYENGEWILKKGIEDIYDHKEILLEEWIENEQDKYPELRDKFEKYLHNKEDDNILNNIKQEIRLMMYNKKNQVVTNQKNDTLLTFEEHDANGHEIMA